jgi:hypothetical protein
MPYFLFSYDDTRGQNAIHDVNYQALTLPLNCHSCHYRQICVWQGGGSRSSFSGQADHFYKLPFWGKESTPSIQTCQKPFFILGRPIVKIVDEIK